jgi:hypothetical protein
MTDGQRVRVFVDRNSVAMGDDVRSHREVWEFPASATLDDLLLAISQQLLPSVSGPAGWCIYRVGDEPSRRTALGMIYSRDDLRQERRIGQVASRGRNRVEDFAHDGRLFVQATYLTGNAGLLRTVSEVSAGASSTGAQPTVLESQARDDALIDWRLADQNKRLATEARGTRRAWVREHLRTIAELPSAQAFVANNFHIMTRLLCPASMRIAGELLGLPHEVRTGAEAVMATGDASSATLAMVLAAFEWGFEKQLTWHQADAEDCAVYMDFLGRAGYQLSEIEQVIAGRRRYEELTDRQKRVRMLRNSEYHLGRNHGFKLMSHEQYLAALAPVSAELERLGEKPEPPWQCCPS